MKFHASKNGLGDKTTSDGICCFQCRFADLIDIGFWFRCQRMQMNVAAKEGCDSGDYKDGCE